MIKVKALSEDKQMIFAIANMFQARIVDVSIGSLIIEVIGKQSKIDALLGLLEGYEILELARTGITGLSRGTFDVKVSYEDGVLLDYDSLDKE